ncbi:hypothetical protein N9L68_04455 [bacterium]|nr:hypothetical protein [bacterium]
MEHDAAVRNRDCDLALAAGNKDGRGLPCNVQSCKATAISSSPR